LIQARPSSICRNFERYLHCETGRQQCRLPAGHRKRIVERSFINVGTIDVTVANAKMTAPKLQNDDPPQRAILRSGYNIKKD
jgi:hypothetical protein